MLFLSFERDPVRILIIVVIAATTVSVTCCHAPHTEIRERFPGRLVPGTDDDKVGSLMTRDDKAILLMIDVYYFESTLKTNRFDCNWGIRQKRYKSKNSIIRTSKETRVDHDDED